MSSGRIARHRNYSELMRQHERGTRLKRVLRVFLYLIIAMILIVLLVMVTRWEQRTNKKTSNHPTVEITTRIT